MVSQLHTLQQAHFLHCGFLSVQNKVIHKSKSSTNQSLSVRKCIVGNVFDLSACVCTVNDLCSGPPKAKVLADTSNKHFVANQKLIKSSTLVINW